MKIFAAVFRCPKQLSSYTIVYMLSLLPTTMAERSHQRQQRYSHRLWKFRGFVVDVCHPHTNRGGARVRLVSAVCRHHHKLVEMVGPFVVQATRGKDGPMRWDAEVRAQGVICELGVWPRVTVCCQHCRGEVCVCGGGRGDIITINLQLTE